MPSNLVKAKMGYGYGSEFQLLRFMGRYRNHFEQSLFKELKLAENTKVTWLDYQSHPSDPHLDQGLRNADFLNETLRQEWHSLWPSSDIEWDSIAKLNLNGKETYILINAKATASDITTKDKCNLKDQVELEKLRQAIQGVKDVYRISHPSDWTKSAYQLASRLVFKKFLEDNNIPNFLVEVYFIKGYEYSYSKGLMDKPKSIKSQSEWLRLIKQKHSNMGINNTILESGSPKERINELFIVCG